MSKKSKKPKQNPLFFTAIITVIVLMLSILVFCFQKNRLNIKSQSVEPIFCSGIMGKRCPKGYWCKLEGKYPDAGGTCLKKDLIHWNY